MGILPPYPPVEPPLDPCDSLVGCGALHFMMDEVHSVDLGKSDFRNLKSNM